MDENKERTVKGLVFIVVHTTYSEEAKVIITPDVFDTDSLLEGVIKCEENIAEHTDDLIEPKVNIYRPNGDQVFADIPFKHLVELKEYLK